MKNKSLYKINYKSKKEYFFFLHTPYVMRK